MFLMLFALILHCFCSPGEKNTEFSLISEIDFPSNIAFYIGLAKVNETCKQTHPKIQT